MPCEKINTMIFAMLLLCASAGKVAGQTCQRNAVKNGGQITDVRQCTVLFEASELERRSLVLYGLACTMDTTVIQCKETTQQDCTIILAKNCTIASTNCENVVYTAFDGNIEIMISTSVAADADVGRVFRYVLEDCIGEATTTEEAPYTPAASIAEIETSTLVTPNGTEPLAQTSRLQDTTTSTQIQQQEQMENLAIPISLAAALLFAAIALFVCARRKWLKAENHKQDNGPSTVQSTLSVDHVDERSAGNDDTAYENAPPSTPRIILPRGVNKDLNFKLMASLLRRKNGRRRGTQEHIYSYIDETKDGKRIVTRIDQFYENVEGQPEDLYQNQNNVLYNMELYENVEDSEIKQEDGSPHEGDFYENVNPGSPQEETRESRSTSNVLYNMDLYEDVNPGNFGQQEDSTSVDNVLYTLEQEQCQQKEDCQNVANVLYSLEAEDSQQKEDGQSVDNVLYSMDG